MTYCQSDLTLPVEYLEEIAAQRFDALPELIRTVMNEAMQMERQKYLGVAPYERSSKRQGRREGHHWALRFSFGRSVKLQLTSKTSTLSIMK